MIDELIRKIPDFRGKRRMVRMLRSHFLENASDITVRGKFDCLYRLPNVKEPIGFEIFCNGIYEMPTIRFLLKAIPNEGMFLDLGANIGALSVPLLKLRPDINCICVEAVPWICSYLNDNLSSNILGKYIPVINKALFDRSDEIMSFYCPGDLFGKGSLSPVFTQVATPVRTITLDRMIELYEIKRVDLIKMDIEGFEYFALKGGKKLLSGPDAPDILFEFNDWTERLAELKIGAAQEHLLNMGYKLFRFTEKGKLIKMKNIKREGSTLLWASKKDKCEAKVGI